MSTLWIAFGSIALYLVAYHTYGRWLARRIFRLDPEVAPPSVELSDDRGVTLGKRVRDSGSRRIHHRAGFPP